MTPTTCFYSWMKHTRKTIDKMTPVRMAMRMAFSETKTTTPYVEKAKVIPITT